MSTLTDALPATRTESIAELKRRAVRLRIEIVKMIGAAGSGHPGGSLSEVELLLGLYFRVLRHNPKDPNWADRDRFILSKRCASSGRRSKAILINGFFQCSKPIPARWDKESPSALAWRSRPGSTTRTSTPS